MNYIKRLEEENSKLRAAIDEAKRGIHLLEEYCFSDKYSQDPYVLNKDVALRLEETLRNVNELEP